MSIRAWVAGPAIGLIGLIGACSLDDRIVTGASLASRPGADASVGGVPGVFGSGGDGPGVGVLGVEPAAFDFGAAVIGVPSRTRVAVLNGGDGALGAVSAALAASSDRDYVVLLDGCESGVAPAEHCDIRLQLVPSKEGTSAATLEVESSGQAAQVALAASGVAPGPLTLAPSAGSSADFGGVVLAATAEMSFDVSNPTQGSSGPLAISINDPQFQLLPPAGEGCQPGITALANGQRCSVRVAFSPSRRGPVEASLVINSPLGGSSLPLAARGNTPGSLAAPASVDFGGVVLGGTAQRTLRLQNAGDESLVLGGVALAGAAALAAPPSAIGDAGPLARGQAPALGGNDAFSIQNSDCGAGMVLAGGRECTLTVGFRPLVAGVDQQTQLVVGAANGTAIQIALAGSGLNEGALVIAPVDGSPTAFGELLVGQSQTLQFVVTNPSAQLSGPLQFITSDDFAALPPTAPGDCQSGVTSLVNGQRCVISVGFTPRARGQRDGSLLVSSALAGSVHQPLSGSGLAPAHLVLPRAELDFGRVPTETPVQQRLTIVNDGDQPIAAVQATLEAAGGGPAQGFTLQGACAGPITAATPCELGIQFSPLEASAYAAVLRVVSDGSAGSNTGASSTASALLLGRAFPRGSLVLSSSAGTTDFGDVVLGSSSTLSFTLQNPGSVASGRLTLATSNNAFTVSEGDCNPAGSTGLVDGSSCTFSVTFAPTTSEALSVNLSVQSPGAGETALSLTGRGRTAPSLTATGNRDFGSANVNEQALTNPTNQFTWTVTNDGDMDSGPLAIENSNAAEFIVSNDTCANVPVVGHGTCTMDIRFLPSSSGARSASLTVTDTVSSQALVLAMTGNGIVIAGPGGSCVNATCGAGICTGGVCCDRACVSGCQACSAAGVCADQAERQSCGDGSGVCFGVDQCLLPELQACSGDNQCGSGNCERRLGGQGPADSICCLDDCGITGQQCNPQTGRCQVPALGAGQACGAAGQPACGAGLECKSCLTGGSQCTPSDGCCGGCPGEQVCTGGECACPTNPGGGLQQIHCGSGRCIPNAAGACCDTASGCDGDLQCNATNDLCACPAGSRECTAGSGACLPNAQCCNCGGPCNQCNNGQCLPIGNGQQGGCVDGQVCQNGSCAVLSDVQLGEACNQTANNCANGSCNAQGICACSGNDPKQCGNFCRPAATCCEDCAALGQQCLNGSCAPLAPAELGEACEQAANNCATGTCNAQGICAECEGSGVVGCPELGGTSELVCNGGVIVSRSCPIGQGCGVNDQSCTPQSCGPRSFLPDCASRTARLFCADSGRDASVSDCPAERPFCDATVRDLQTPGTPIACQVCLTDADCLARGDGTTTCNPPGPGAPAIATLNTCD
jgi:ASPM-SPD-2-Hydin domain-containing protein